MKAAILAVGDELLGGRCLDTNSHWLCDHLSHHGVTVVETRSVGDDQARIVTALRSLSSTADLVIMTGGLGPTQDDLTREAVAEFAGQDLVVDASALEWITTFFRERDMTMGDAQKRIAMRPEHATCHRNGVGTAPSIRMSIGGGDLWLLPGPPAEMHDAWDSHVSTWLQQASGGQPATPAVTIKAFGLIEAELEARLGDLTRRDHCPQLGTRISQDEFLLHVDPVGVDDAGYQACVADVEARLQPYVFGRQAETLSDVVGAALLARGESLVTAESCTGGGIGSCIVDVAGSSQWFRGGWITYSNEMKQEFLGVPAGLLEEHGAVSEPVVAAMAEGAARQSGAQWALAVSGIAGPGGGTADKPVGTVWMACHGPTGVTSRRFRLGADRSRIRMRTVKMALQVLRWRLRDIDPMTPTSWDAT